MRSAHRRRLVCHHEAAHAVVRWWLGHVTERAVVLTVIEHASGVEISNRHGESHVVEGAVMGYALAEPDMRRLALRAPRAERDEHRLRFDARVRMSLVESYAGAVAEARYRRKSLKWCVLEGGLGDTDDAWRLAAGWFGGKAAAGRACIESGRIARSFVRSPKAWAAISAVAAALHGRGELGGAEIAALCAEAYGGEPAYDAWAPRWPPTAEEIRSGHLPVSACNASKWSTRTVDR